MSRKGYLEHGGYVALEPRFDDNPYRPHGKVVPQAEVDVCMNCTKPECKHGNCKLHKEMKRKIKEEKSNG